MEDNSEGSKVINEFVIEILDYIEFYKDKVPQGFSAVMKRKIAGIEDALESLEVLFKEEEATIGQKRSANQSGIDDYENGVREFAVSIIRLLYPKYVKLKHYAAYRRLFAQKHMAYAFFHAMNNYLFAPIVNIDYSEFHMESYLGLVSFYKNFYGRFSDNEEAIELLCKYYPRDLEVGRYSDQIAEALYKHICSAGTPNDKGYAFQGIEKIECYIGTLPTAIIMKLLGLYHVRYIVSNAICRHQVYAIVTYAQTDNVEKKSLKFLLVDSVVLAQLLEPYLERRISGKVSIFSSIQYEKNYITDPMQVCKEPDACWSVDMKNGERIFSLNKRPMVKILLNNTDRIEISSIDEKGDKEVLEIPYSAGDWLLESYFSKEVEQKLRKLILGTESQYNEMFFSLLYLDNYRGMKNQIIDFDHKFQYAHTYKSLKQREKNLYQIESFYGQAVQTLSCIVGKNGRGKTSIIDFLREFFFNILRLIEDYGIPCEQGYIKEPDYKEYNILDEGAGFLIVFHMGRSSFFLTNISNVKCDGAEPFRAGIYNSVNEFSKAAYFSNMLKNNQEDLFMEDSVRRVSDIQVQEKREIGRSLRGFRQVDYSETESFIRRRKAIALDLGKRKDLKEKAEEKGSVNRELCYQLTFLKNMDAGRICEYLDMDKHRIFKISSKINGWAEEAFSSRCTASIFFIRAVCKICVSGKAILVSGRIPWGNCEI